MHSASTRRHWVDTHILWVHGASPPHKCPLRLGMVGRHVRPCGRPNACKFRGVVVGCGTWEVCLGRTELRGSRCWHKATSSPDMDRRMSVRTLPCWCMVVPHPTCFVSIGNNTNATTSVCDPRGKPPFAKHGVPVPDFGLAAKRLMGCTLMLQAHPRSNGTSSNPFTWAARQTKVWCPHPPSPRLSTCPPHLVGRLACKRPCAQHPLVFGGNWGCSGFHRDTANGFVATRTTRGA